MKVLVSTSSFGKYDRAPVELLEKSGFDISFNPLGRKLAEEEIKELLMHKDGLIAGTEPITKNVIQSAKDLKVISRCGTGTDNIDMKAVREKGIKLYKTPENPAIAVAELTLGLIFDALRYQSYMDRAIRFGKWEKRMGRLLTGKTVGVIGLGYAGKKLTEFLTPFGCNILAYDINRDKEFAGQYNVIYTSIDDVVTSSDIISVHLPLTESTNGFISEKILLKMKDQAIFINTSRGEIVNEDALYNMLKQERISYACLDVFCKEPYRGKLTELPNVTLTCHAGSYAREARIRMELKSVENLLEGLELS